jgi:hypothetical protein
MSKKTKKQSLKPDIIQSIRKLRSLSDSLRNLSSDIRKDDRLAVIIFCASVELVLDFFVEKVCKHGSKLSGKNRSFMTKVYILDELKLIDNKILNNLTNLKKLRDDAAHKLQKEVKWKGKFAFDKNSTVYKATIELFGEPQDLVGYLFYVWNTFFLVACEEIPKREFDKIVDWQKKVNQKQ